MSLFDAKTRNVQVFRDTKWPFCHQQIARGSPHAPYFCVYNELAQSLSENDINENTALAEVARKMPSTGFTFKYKNLLATLGDQMLKTRKKSTNNFRHRLSTIVGTKM